MTEASRVLVIGAGIYGICAALELRRRGHRTTVVDTGPVPHPLAASTDISKVCRMEYGADSEYTALAEKSRLGWLAWNDRWVEAGRDPLYHEVGVLMLARRAMAPGGFEHDSFRTIVARGHTPERMDDADRIARRFPAWSTRRYVDGFFHSKGGFVESGRVVETLVEEALRLGVNLVEGSAVKRFLQKADTVAGVELADGQILEADCSVVAAGSWTHKLVPELQPVMRASGHAVFHLEPKDPELFQGIRFPVFTADIAETGFYGFPLHPVNKVVKIGLHDLGTPIDPDAPRSITPEHEERLRAFLPGTFPSLVDAKVVFTRLCLYSDTKDEHLWISRHPEMEGLVVAAGGSGHAFKFAPVLGPLIADVVEGRDNPDLHKFRWRMEIASESGKEAARCHRSPPVGEG